MKCLGHVLCQYLGSLAAVLRPSCCGGLVSRTAWVMAWRVSLLGARPAWPRLPGLPCRARGAGAHHHTVTMHSPAAALPRWVKQSLAVLLLVIIL